LNVYSFSLFLFLCFSFFFFSFGPFSSLRFILISEPTKPATPVQTTEPTQPAHEAPKTPTEPAHPTPSPTPLSIPPLNIPHPAPEEQSESEHVKPKEDIPEDLRLAVENVSSADVMSDDAAPAERKRTLTFALDVPEKEEHQRKSTLRMRDPTVVVEVGLAKTASIREIPTSPRMFIDGRTLRRGKLVDKNGEIGIPPAPLSYLISTLHPSFSLTCV